METGHRFAGKLSEDYDLVRVMIPHYDEHQDTIHTAIEAFALTHTPIEILPTIDIGCGTGFTAERILDADPRTTLIAIDNEPAMMDQARVRLERFGNRVTFYEMDALEAIGRLPARSAEIVASGCVLHNLPHDYRWRLMRKIGRVLVPGGLFVNADKFGLDDPMEHMLQLAEQLKNISVLDDMGRSDLREAWHAHYLEDEEINFTESEQKALLRESGFWGITTIYRKRLEATIAAFKK
ncbi:MAG TPA: class I SAM-dependent methyltransferase [Candidatus Paceibacterota bacterium]|nr:class I SAM-dependent methyltransferase [Candidatus Paceibacterota bacterium]